MRTESPDPSPRGLRLSSVNRGRGPHLRQPLGSAYVHLAPTRPPSPAPSAVISPKARSSTEHTRESETKQEGAWAPWRRWKSAAVPPSRAAARHEAEATRVGWGTPNSSLQRGLLRLRRGASQGIGTAALGLEGADARDACDFTVLTVSLLLGIMESSLLS